MRQRPTQDKTESGTWNFRAVPRDTIRKAKIIAAVDDLSVKDLLIRLVDWRWSEFMKKGNLPEEK